MILSAFTNIYSSGYTNEYTSKLRLCTLRLYNQRPDENKAYVVENLDPLTPPLQNIMHFMFV